MEWSRWEPSDKSAGYKRSAVYLIWLAKEGLPDSIPRFLGVDEEGILCIGETSNFDERRRRFVQGIRRGICCVC